MGSWGSQGDPGKKEQGSGAMPGLRCETLSQNKRAEDVFVGTAVAWHVVKVSGFHGRGDGDMVRFVCLCVSRSLSFTGGRRRGTRQETVLEVNEVLNFIAKVKNDVK